MVRFTSLCPAKLNLIFDIVGALPDGYHRVSTLYQAIDLEDKISFDFSWSNENRFQIKTNNSIADNQFPADSSNLIWRAAQLYLASLPKQRYIKMSVEVEKNIPIAAGLAGGSSNAAACLLALNSFCEHQLSDEELHGLASKLGADVPFCLQGGTSIGLGRGDELTAVETQATPVFLIVKPENLSIATPWAYQEYDRFQGKKYSFDLNAGISALKSGDLKKAAQNFGNAFEPVIFTHYPELAKIQELLLEVGALCCHLTGKGPTLYALVTDKAAGEKMSISFLERYQNHTSKLKSNSLKCWISQAIPFGARLTMQPGN